MNAFYQQDAKETDAYFIEVLKEGADIVASVKHVISRIEVEKLNITTTFTDYKRRVESLHKEIAEKQASLKDLAAQKEEVTSLQDELDKISRDISDLKNIEKQLQAEKENISDEKIIAKLRELSKMLPAGVEY